MVGADPLFSHVYFFQPTIRNGNYIPRQLVKAVKLPTNNLKVEHFHMKGREIAYVVGSETSDLEVTFYENQLMQVTGFINSWMSTTHTPGGGKIALPSQYKEMMIFLHNQSFGNSTGTLLNDLAYKTLPNNILNDVEYAGITIIFGTFPKNSPSYTYENLKGAGSEGSDEGACTFTTNFNVDYMFQFPLSVDFSSILQILGYSDPTIFSL